MAVTAKRLIRSVQATQTARRVPPQIFIAHCALSETLLQNIIRVIRSEGVIPFIANTVQNSTHPVRRVVQEMYRSDALFVVLTKTILRRRLLRDWIFFEIGLANGIWMGEGVEGSQQHTIFGWKEGAMKLPEKNPIQTIRNYQLLNMRSQISKNAMLKEMKSIAHRISILSTMKR